MNTTQTTEAHDHDADRPADPYIEYEGRCPKCDGALTRFSPSGQGRAACDACETWWE